MEHHAYVVAGSVGEGKAAAIQAAEAFVGRAAKGNPDILVREYGLCTVEDARAVHRALWQSPLGGERKAIIICASRVYHEAQNALLKVFEEPPEDTALYLVVPHEGMLIATLRSRLLPLPGYTVADHDISEEAKEFLHMSQEKRSAFIKKLADMKGEERGRAARDRAIAVLDGVEQAVYARWSKDTDSEPLTTVLKDISVLRGYLHERSAPLRMILEHVSLILPKKPL